MQTEHSTKDFWHHLATRSFYRRFGFMLLTLGFMSLYAPAAFAATGFNKEQLYEIQTGTGHYNPDANCAGGAAPTPGANSAFNNAGAEALVQQYSKNGINVGYALFNANGQSVAESNDTFENYGASITKAMILVAYLNQVGSATLSDTAKQELTQMIEVSDDSASNAVFGLLKDPQTEINAVAQQAGMTNFKYNDTADSLYRLGQSQITAQDFAKFFSKITNMFPGNQKDFATQLLSTITPSAGLLKASLPGTIYSKEGWKPEPGGGSDPPVSGDPNPFGNEGAPYIVNQAAQFQSNGSTYGIAVTVAGTKDEASGETIIQDIASALVQTSSTQGSGDAAQSCSCSGGSNAGSNVGKVGTVDWHSNASQPYYLEQFIINILEALASVTNKPSTSAVTQAHVVAMVAWAYQEGGNITNKDIFNVWNSGIGIVHPELVLGGTSASGVESFKNFDDGVDAMVYSVTQSYQNRIGNILLDPNSTAQQVINAIADWQSYPGNQNWATDPNYLKELDTILSQTNSNYNQEASVEIGFGEEGQHHVPVSQLQFGTGSGGSGSGNTGSSSSSTCTSSSGTGNCPTNDQAGSGDATILACAEQYANIYYQYGGGHEDYATFRKGCPLSMLANAPNSTAAKQSSPGNTGPCATDCSGLVSMSLDQAFKLDYQEMVSGSGVMIGSGSNYWKEVPKSQAQPGDVITLADGTGHVEIVVKVDGSNVTTFGSHSTGSVTGIRTDSKGQPQESPLSYWAATYEWTGPGSK